MVLDKRKLTKNPRVKTTMISIRVPVSASIFMKREHLSPTKIMIASLKELGWSPPNETKD